MQIPSCCYWTRGQTLRQRTTPGALRPRPPEASARDSLLMLASYQGHADTVMLLLDKGADPETANDRGQTPLAGAAFKGNVAMMEILVEGGAQVDGVSGDGKTPLMYAAMFDQVEAVSFLLARGADIERADVNGVTALGLARAMGAKRTPELLLVARKTTH